MKKFKEILKTGNPQELSRQLTVQGNPVWDYKTLDRTIYLISSINHDLEEDDHVTVGELRKYMVDKMIHFDTLNLGDEHTMDPLTDCSNEGDLKLNLT